MLTTKKQRRDSLTTKKVILEAAFKEMHVHGYQAASINHILKRTGLSKGALFHHYKHKLALGYAVFDTLIEPLIVDVWVRPLRVQGNAIDQLQHLLRTSVMALSQHPHLKGQKSMLLGCPLHQIAQEMAALDAGFKQRVNQTYMLWQNSIAHVLLEGQRTKVVKSEVDVENTAMFLVASISGAMAMGKRTQSLAQCLEVLHGCAEHLALYLEQLRAS